jgi:hypothetical protein
MIFVILPRFGDKKENYLMETNDFFGRHKIVCLFF